MARLRSLIQNTLHDLLSGRTDAERRAAVNALFENVNQYLESDEVGESPIVAPRRGVTSSTIKALDGRLIPASTFSEADLQIFNQLLSWGARTADPSGRILGQQWSSSKRPSVAHLVDPRQLAFDATYNFSGRHVLEVGCFEGIHSIGLLLLGASVTAVDGRLENVLKTLARTWAYGVTCNVIKWDLEEAASAMLPEQWDVLHHIGVLYHLADPIGHLDTVLPRTSGGVLLDTHVADSADAADLQYVVNGATFRYRRKPEPHAGNSPFAGMRDHAKYLVLEDLIEHLQTHGFEDIRVVSNRLERNGRRVTVWAFR